MTSMSYSHTTSNTHTTSNRESASETMLSCICFFLVCIYFGFVSVVCEDNYRRSCESGSMIHIRAGRQLCKVDGGIDAAHCSHSQM